MPCGTGNIVQIVNNPAKKKLYYTNYLKYIAVLFYCKDLQHIYFPFHLYYYPQLFPVFFLLE